MLNKEQIKDFMTAMKENGDTDPMQVSLENITTFADTQGVEVSEVMEFCQVAHEMDFMSTFSAADEDTSSEDNFSEEEESETEDETQEEDTTASEEESEEFSDEEFARKKKEPPKEEPKSEDKPAEEPPKEEEKKPEDKPVEMSEEEKVATKEQLTALKDKIAQTGNFAEGDNLKEFIQCCGQVAEIGKKIAKPEEFAKTVFDKTADAPKDEEKKPEDKPADEKPAEEAKDAKKEDKKEGKPANFSEGSEDKSTFDYLDRYLK